MPDRRIDTINMQTRNTPEAVMSAAAVSNQQCERTVCHQLNICISTNIEIHI